MKELLVVSGKGGTGKTTIAAALAVLTQDKVIADCDVDAADLWLVLHPASIRKDAFRGLDKAIVDRNKCTGCGLCFEVCRFDAVASKVRSRSSTRTHAKDAVYAFAVARRRR